MVIPALILGSLNAKNLWDEHWEHWEHLPPLEERVQYPYMNIRTKAYPWGDGDKVSLYGNFIPYQMELICPLEYADSLVSSLPYIELSLGPQL